MIKFVVDYQPQLLAKKIKNACLKWLRPLERTAEEVAEEVCIEHYVAVLPDKPQRDVPPSPP